MNSFYFFLPKLKPNIIGQQISKSSSINSASSISPLLIILRDNLYPRSRDCSDLFNLVTSRSIYDLE